MRQLSVSAPETARLLGLKPAAAILMALLFVAAAFYFPWRLGTFNPDAPILSVLVYAAELFGLFGICLHLFMTSRVTERAPPAPLEGATVDLFVTTYNEPVSMLRRTLAAAKHVRLATRIVLLDDGARPQMRKLAEELGVDYIARTNNMHAKAGNLNNALDHSSADFVATFDADHAPAPDFLERTLGYFRSEHVALVQTPQDFYNLDSFQHRRFGKSNRFWTEQSLFFRVVQPGKDRWNAAFYCGSCAVLRRFALNRIGGFATGTLTEDLHTSIRLHKAGFDSVYHNQTLAYGIAPSSYEPYESQRVRWGKGAMQVWRKEGVLFARGLTIPQRLCYLASIITYFDAWQKLLFYVLPPLVLLSGVMPMANVNWEFLARFLPWFALCIIAGEELGRGYARSWTIEQYNFLRAPAFLRATLSMFLPADKIFHVTRKSGIKPGGARGQLLVMTLVPVLCLAAVPLGIMRYLSDAHLPLAALIANIVWALAIGIITAAAIRFAWSRTSDRREDYRFTAPLPFDVHLPSGGWGTLRALDMTPDGVRLAAPMGLDFAVGRKLDAVVRLPSGPAKVTLRVRHRALVVDEPLPKRMEIGCALTWNSKEDQDQLNALLYGGGLDQQLLGLTETAPTVLDQVLRVSNTKPERDVRRAWAPAAAETGDAQFDIAAQPGDDLADNWRVFSYQPLSTGTILRLPTKAGGESATALRVIETRAIQVGGAAVHLSTVAVNDDAPARIGVRKAKAQVEPWVLAGVGVVAIAALLIASTTASAIGEEPMALIGVEVGDTSSYAYAGVVAPLPGQEGGNGWAGRFIGDRLSYQYETNGVDVDAEGYGGEAAIMHRWSGEWGYANLALGARYRDTETSPEDAGNGANGGHLDAAVSGEVRTHVNEKVDVAAMASHTIEQNDTFVRAGVDRDMGGWRAGVDATHVSGERYSENKAGITASWRLRNDAALSARAGASRNEDGRSGGYLGLGLALNLN